MVSVMAKLAELVEQRRQAAAEVPRLDAEITLALAWP